MLVLLDFFKLSVPEAELKILDVMSHDMIMKLDIDTLEKLLQLSNLHLMIIVPIVDSLTTVN